MKLLNLSDQDFEKIGKLFENSVFFRAIPKIDKEDSNSFFNSIFSDLLNYLDPKYFMIANLEFTKTVYGSELLAELMVNLDLLPYQNNCDHKENEIIYRKKNSTYFPIYKEKEITFCCRCFIEYYQKKLNQNLPKIDKNDTVGIGVSGEKDSMAALKAVLELRKDFNLIVFFVDEGITGPNSNIDYRKICEEKVVELCKENNIPLKIYRYKEIFGFTIDELYKLGYNPCHFDSQLLSIIANKFVYDNNISIMLSNRTEDEILQLNLLALEGSKFNLRPVSQNIKSFTKFIDHEYDSYNIVHNIKGEENKLYLQCTNTDYNSTIKCPYGSYNMGKLNKNLVNGMECAHPGAIRIYNDSLNKFFKNSTRKIKNKPFIEIRFCEICKLPTLSTLKKECLVCSLKKRIGY
jgi:tRNA(Ile)-lysidine synthase TilS/MesJ